MRYAPGPSGYEVGMPDPTPNDGDHDCCEFVCSPHGLCTRPEGHAGQHVAGNEVDIVGVA